MKFCLITLLLVSSFAMADYDRQGESLNDGTAILEGDKEFVANHVLASASCSKSCQEYRNNVASRRSSSVGVLTSGKAHSETSK